MLCKQVPKDKTKYYATHDMKIVHKLMENGVYPLYSDGTIFYFVKTGKFENVCLLLNINL